MGEDDDSADIEYETMMEMRKRTFKKAQDIADGNFQPTETFGGAKQGFTFTTGEHGPGYYRDDVGGGQVAGKIECTAEQLPPRISELKERGNAEYKEGALRKAANTYTEGLTLLADALQAGKVEGAKEMRLSLLLNRAQCKLGLGEYKETEEDCIEVLRANPGCP